MSSSSCILRSKCYKGDVELLASVDIIMQISVAPRIPNDTKGDLKIHPFIFTKFLKLKFINTA